ncbi:putative F-box protein At3g25460 [Rutidosis leptorrhynchoides]|uniref:putative F-box protein At3g25460 n=1 Tax=Rutidosis leptorrhynchoides TaxID=125765 RepID=UPI003A99E5F9
MSKEVPEDVIIDILLEVPEDVIIDILLRVPTRYILRFKSISKSWYALFQNPNFISKHFFHNQSTLSDPAFLFTLTESSISASPSVCTVGLILSDFSYKSIKIPIEIHVLKPLYVCGSCNGLICLSILPLGSVILLWNPATRVFKDLPISPIDHSGYRPSAVVLGFGFDDVIKDYKVLRILHNGYSMKQVEIYSLSTNSWREIKINTIVGFIIVESACRVFFNGKFYWDAVSVVDNHHTKLIVCFDLREEVFNFIMPPKYEFTGHIGDNLNVDWHVVAIKESLAVIGWLSLVSGVTMFEVRAMKEYGVWTKYTSFELQETRFVRLLGCGLKGEILLEKDYKQLVLYDPISERVNNLENFGYVTRSKVFNVFNHVGSLIPINGGKVATRTNLSSIVRDPFFVQ